MKTKTIALIMACTLSAVITGKTFSQNRSGQKGFNHSYTAQLIANLGALNLDTNASADFSPAMNTKVQRSFDALFQNATNQQWSFIDGMFLCRFNLEGVRNHALFNKKGRLIYTVTYGQENQMSPALVALVKSNYDRGYAIKSAIEVKQGGRDIWVVELENEVRRVTVRVEDGETQEVRQITLLN